MERYKNTGGDSGVLAFEISQDAIKVQFKDGSIYLYNTQSAGSSNIAEMHRLASSGQGLNSFINRVVKKKYAKRIQ